MSSSGRARAAFDITNSVRRRTFGFPNTSRFRERGRLSSHVKQAVLIGAVLLARVRTVWQQPWPLTARVPIVSGALILTIAVSHVMMCSIGVEQELGVRRIAAVYLVGISTTIYPHVFSRNLANTTEALRLNHVVPPEYPAANSGPWYACLMAICSPMCRAQAAIATPMIRSMMQD